MPKHYNVHLIHVYHVTVPDDAAYPEDMAIEVATSEFIHHTQEQGIEEMMTGLATNRLDVYLVDPCDCGRET